LEHADCYTVSRGFILFGAELGGQFLAFDAVLLGEPVTQINQLAPFTTEWSVWIRFVC
jgi:hypothetical protein